MKTGGGISGRMPGLARRLLGGVLLAAWLAAAAMASATLARGVHHDCTGHDCPTCELLAQGWTLLESVEGVASPAAAAWADVPADREPEGMGTGQLVVRAPPVARKERLDM